MAINVTLKFTKVILIHMVSSESIATSVSKLAHIGPFMFVSFGSKFYVPVNSYCHVQMVSSPNHDFFLGKLD